MNKISNLFFAALLFIGPLYVLGGFANQAWAQETLPWLKKSPKLPSAAEQNPLPPDEFSQPSARPPRAPSRPTTDFDVSPRPAPQPRTVRPQYENAPPQHVRRPPYGQPDQLGRRYDQQKHPYDPQRTYSDDEIVAAGHQFFGAVSANLAKVIEHAFAKSGRPTGFILGEEAGGAFVAGLRYGEGTLYTKFANPQPVFWQGPSIGYDFGAEGSKTLILVYNLYDPREIYQTFGGIDGSAYLVGGVGITFQSRDHITLAPIRSGVGARLGANVGYLKYTRYPTWNPF